MNKNFKKAHSGITLVIDISFLAIFVGLNVYNLASIAQTDGNFKVYLFQLTHIASLLMTALVIASLIYKWRRYDKTKELQSKNFSNAISFAFALSLLVDIMYWVFIYKPTLTSTQFTDALLMHGIITVVFFFWILWKNQCTLIWRSEDYQNAFDQTNQSDSDIEIGEKKILTSLEENVIGKSLLVFFFPIIMTFRQLSKSSNQNKDHEQKDCSKFLKVLFYAVLLPIYGITRLYMGWTYLGQKLLNTPIYSNVIDWNSPSHALTIFGMAFALFVVLALAYNLLSLSFNENKNNINNNSRSLEDESNNTPIL